LIDRVLLLPQRIVPVLGGDVMHAIRSSSEGFAGFGEAYFSKVEPGVTKAWKRHRLMTLNLVVPVGRVAIGVLDMDASTGRIYELGHESYARLNIPPGIWTGFRSLSTETSLMMNIANIEHDPDESDRMPETAVDFLWDALPFPSGPDQDIRL
jgi:dTDP-4-dehydrorhamnose 3,5-epimerase